MKNINSVCCSNKLLYLCSGLNYFGFNALKMKFFKPQLLATNLSFGENRGLFGFDSRQKGYVSMSSGVKTARKSRFTKQ